MHLEVVVARPSATTESCHRTAHTAKLGKVYGAVRFFLAKTRPGYALCWCGGFHPAQMGCIWKSLLLARRPPLRAAIVLRTQQNWAKSMEQFVFFLQRPDPVMHCVGAAVFTQRKWDASGSRCCSPVGHH